jgi:hypothetical protein
LKIRALAKCRKIRVFRARMRLESAEGQENGSKTSIIKTKVRQEEEEMLICLHRNPTVGPVDRHTGPSSKPFPAEGDKAPTPRCHGSGYRRYGAGSGAGYIKKGGRQLSPFSFEGLGASGDQKEMNIEYVTNPTRPSPSFCVCAILTESIINLSV